MKMKDCDRGLFILTAIHKVVMAVSHGNNSLLEWTASGLQFARFTSAKEKINSPHAVTQGKFALIKLPWHTSKRELAAFFSHKWLGTKRREKLAWTWSGRRDWSRVTGGLLLRYIHKTSLACNNLHTFIIFCLAYMAMYGLFLCREFNELI